MIMMMSCDDDEDHDDVMMIMVKSCNSSDNRSVETYLKYTLPSRSRAVEWPPDICSTDR